MSYMDGLMTLNNGMMDYYHQFLSDYVLILNQIKSG